MERIKRYVRTRHELMMNLKPFPLSQLLLGLVLKDDDVTILFRTSTWSYHDTTLVSLNFGRTHTCDQSHPLLKRCDLGRVYHMCHNTSRDLSSTTTLARSRPCVVCMCWSETGIIDEDYVPKLTSCFSSSISTINPGNAAFVNVRRPQYLSIFR